MIVSPANLYSEGGKDLIYYNNIGLYHSQYYQWRRREGADRAR
jgi:hypothetical protein